MAILGKGGKLRINHKFLHGLKGKDSDTVKIGPRTEKSEGGFCAPMEKAAVYVRLSTKDQPVEMQLEDLREYLAEAGWELVEEYVDEGYSKRTPSAPPTPACWTTCASDAGMSYSSGSWTGWREASSTWLARSKPSRNQVTLLGSIGFCHFLGSRISCFQLPASCHEGSIPSRKCFDTAFRTEKITVGEICLFFRQKSGQQLFIGFRR